MNDEGLQLWTVYKHPSDYPDHYVARLFFNEEPQGFMVAAETIDALRKPLQKMGLTRLERSADDDPVIVEVWL